MTNQEIALLQLDGLIAGMEANSSIPVQLSELKMLRILLTADQPIKPAVIAAVAEKNAAIAQPPLRAVKMALFPEMETLNSAVELANSQLPILNTNVLAGVLFTYHNTLLKQLHPK